MVGEEPGLYGAPAAGPPGWPRNTNQPALQRFLAGPTSRLTELARAVHIFAEFIRGFRALHFVGPCVTVFGSARFPDGHRYYDLARETARGLAHSGFTVVTGGGPGVMEAANRGAKEAGGFTVGCNIELPEEQKPNPYLDVMIEFRHFFVRKVMLVKYSYAFVALPGGLGTMDEIFETLTLIQTRKILDFPVVLLGSEYWQPLVDLLRSRMVVEGTIGREDLDLLHLTDSPDEAVRCVNDGAQRTFARRPPPQRPRWLLGEFGRRAA